MAKFGISQALIYVHGTNGSGKSTLARHMIMCSGGVKKLTKHKVTGAKVTYTYGKLALVGWYRSPTGGADGVQPYASVPITALALLKDGHNVLVEGLMTPGVETCAKLCNAAKKLNVYMKFIKLDIGYFQSLENVKRRRSLTGNTKEFDPSNLRKKQRSVEGWFENLAAAHLPVYGLDWENTRDLCLSAFKINSNGAVRLLD